MSRNYYTIFISTVDRRKTVLKQSLVALDIRHIDGLVQDCSICFANALEYCSLAINHRYARGRWDIPNVLFTQICDDELDTQVARASAGKH